MDFLDKLAEAGKLDADQVARIRRNTYEFMKVAHDRPEFHREALMKLGGFGDSVKGFAKGVSSTLKGNATNLVAQMLASAAIAGGAAAGAGAYKALKEPIEKSHSFNKMVEMSPTLQKQDPKMVRAAFNTLHNFNPAYAKDPLVASTFVQNALDWERIDMGQVNALVKARSDMDRGKRGFDPLKYMGNLPMRTTEEREMDALRMEELRGKMPLQAELNRIKIENEERKGVDAHNKSLSEPVRNMAQADRAREEAELNRDLRRGVISGQEGAYGRAVDRILGERAAKIQTRGQLPLFERVGRKKGTPR